MIRLFKIDSVNKIRVLLISAREGVLYRTAGIWKGNLVESSKPCTPKNVGRSNETSAEEQAEIQAAAEVVKKIKEGYVEIASEDIDLTELIIRETIAEKAVSFPKCMLAKDYKAQKFDPEGMLVSAKLDGMRCLAVLKNSTVLLYSRTGEPITIMKHIEQSLLNIHLETGWEGTLDGELYVHTQEDNFQSIMKACRKYRPGISEQVQYHVYDIVDTTSSASNRAYEYTDLLTNNVGQLYPHIQIVEQTLVKEEKVGNILHESFLEDFYEGSMWKAANAVYHEGRGHQLMKKKDFTDAEFLVIDIVPMDAWPDCGKFVCQMADKNTFTATPKGPKHLKMEYLLNKQRYIGKQVTVKYFGLTDDGKPRIAVAKGFRPEGDL